MKKIFVLLIGLSFVGAFFTSSALAANKTSRFRGGATSRYFQSMNKYSEMQKKTRLPRYSSRRRVTRTNWNVIQQRNEESKQLPSRRSSSRAYGGGFSSNTGKSVVQGKRSMKNEFESFSATNVDFKISLPNGFSVVSDTLTLDSGEWEFQKGNTKIKLMATPNTCTAGIMYCLKSKSDTALKAFQETLPQMTMRRNKNVTLDPSRSQLKKDNMGLLVDLYARDYGAGQLTFFDPKNEFIWILRITDPEHATGLMKNDRELYKILSSLSQKSAISSKTSRTSLNTLFGTRNRSTGRSIQNKATGAFGNSAVQEFVAEKVPFHLELPNGFELVSDTIERSSGSMQFEKDDESILITATEEFCNDQTARLIRRCLDEQSTILKKSLQSEFPEARILQDENMQVQLTDSSGSGTNYRRTSSFKSHIGKITILRQKGQRMGYFVFPEPQSGYVWTIRMEAPEEKTAFLNDIRQKTKIINSLFFETTE